MKVWIWIIVVLVVVLGGYWMFSGTSTEVTPTADNSPTADASATNPAADEAAAPAEGQ